MELHLLARACWWAAFQAVSRGEPSQPFEWMAEWYEDEKRDLVWPVERGVG